MPMKMRQFICKLCGHTFERPVKVASYCSLRCTCAVARMARVWQVASDPARSAIRKERAASRKIVKRRVEEEGRCQECSSTEQLHGHHIKPFAKYPDLRNDPANIKVLCWRCHAKEHPPWLAGLIQTPRMRRGSYIECLRCGGSRYVTSIDIRRGKNLFCGEACRLASMKGRRKRVRGEVKCQECGTPRIVRSEKTKYCGDRCKMEAYKRRSRLPIHCASCGKQHQAFARDVRMGTAKYCSRACALAGLNRRKMAERRHAI